MANAGSVALMLFLLMIANGTPVLLKRALGGAGAWPIDAGRRWRDGRPLLGPAKTWRGLVGAVLATAVATWGLGLGGWFGALVALTAHVGDMTSSFTKRRLGIASSGQALGLDQVPEALLPALAAAPLFGLGLVEIAVIVVLFFVGELALSRLLFRLRIRDEPY